MKDKPAREGLENLEKRLDVLTARYDALFDLLAAELGFEAKNDYRWFMSGWPASPRTFAMDEAPPRIRRVKPGTKKA